jgi:hypothetical protein
MKNIHVLPTEKPSIICKLDNVLVLSKIGTLTNDTKSLIRQNMYITNEEKFVRDEYITDGIEVIKATPKLVNAQGLVDRRDWKKIILTTDQDLIKDGVQAIDDEFLEWFVKNPSCEYVNIEKYHGINTSIAEVNYISGDGSLSWQGRSDLRDYKIIIPKEEPKQETLEEFAKRIANDIKHFEIKLDYQDGIYYGIQLGAKWQQEQDKKMYSEEEVENIIQKLMHDVHCGDLCYREYVIDFKLSPRQWFEQLKKK